MTDFEYERSRGRRAELLLDDPLLKEAFEAIHKAIVSQWETSREAAQRDQLWHQLWALQRIRGLLKEHVVTGRMATKLLADLN